MLAARTPKTIGIAMIAIDISSGRAAGMCVCRPFRVMAGLDPAIHVFLLRRSRLLQARSTRHRQGVDGRVKPGHDGAGWPAWARPLIRLASSATSGLARQALPRREGAVRHERATPPLLWPADRLHAAVRGVRAGDRRRAVRADRRRAGGAARGGGGGKRRRFCGGVRARAGAGLRLHRRRRAGRGDGLHLWLVGRSGAGGRAARAGRGDHRRRRSPIASFCGSLRSARRSRRASAPTSAGNSAPGSTHGFRAAST